MSAVDDAIARAEGSRADTDDAYFDRALLATEVKRLREEKSSLIRQLTETEADRDQWHREMRRLRELLYGPNLPGPDLGAIE